MRIILLLLSLTLWSCDHLNTGQTDSGKTEPEQAVTQTFPSRDEVDRVVDAWHQAASDADFEEYFGYFENDSSVFIGTDATERWTIAEFKPWAKPYFDGGQAWDFTVAERHVYFSEDGNTAWFDESLETPNLGPSRGSGVLTLTDGGWKIAHYNLAIPIPNDLVDDVVQQIDSTLNK